MRPTLIPSFCLKPGLIDTIADHGRGLNGQARAAATHIATHIKSLEQSLSSPRIRSIFPA